MEWGDDGTITGRLYDAGGSSIKTVQGTDDSLSSGGIAFRNFGGVKYFDSAEIRSEVSAALSSVGFNAANSQLVLPPQFAFMPFLGSQASPYGLTAYHTFVDANKDPESTRAHHWQPVYETNFDAGFVWSLASREKMENSAHNRLFSQLVAADDDLHLDEELIDVLAKEATAAE